MAEQPISLKYTGKGVDILGRAILGYILIAITLGIYFPWFMNSMLKYICENVRSEHAAGDISHTVEFSGVGVDLLGRFILWYILIIITIGIYSPWAINNMYRYIVENIKIKPNAD